MWIEDGRRVRGGSAGGRTGGRRERPVRREQSVRIVEERQRMVRETLAGRECQLRMRVPVVRTMRRVVMM